MSKKKSAAENSAALLKAINSLRAGLIVTRCDLTTLLGLCAEIARAAGVERINGLAPVKWHARRRAVELQRGLEELEDLDPALAAMVQQQIDESRKQMPPDKS